MKYHLNFILALLVLTCCGSGTNTPPDKTDADNLNLSGKVKRIKIYSAQNCESSVNSQSYKLIEFDQNGFITSETSVNAITGNETKKIYVRDDFGYPLSSETTDQSAKVLQTETYKYADNLLQILIVKTDNSIAEFKYEYFENDSLKKFEKYIDEKISFSCTFEYDTASNETIRKMYNDQNNLTFEFISSVDHVRNLLMTKTLIYDELRPNEPPFTTITNQIFFDEKNNMELNMSYNKFGMMSQESFEYEFDHTENWTLQKIIKEHSLTFCIKREIEYYN